MTTTTRIRHLPTRELAAEQNGPTALPPVSDAPATTPVGIDAGAIAAASSEEDRRAIEALRAHFETSDEVRDPWREVLGDLLSQREVQRRLGVRTTAEVDHLVRQKRLLALPARDGKVTYPAFQFSHEGTPFPVIAWVIDVLSGVVATPYTIASWLSSPRTGLAGETPIRWLELGRDPGQVVSEARLTAAHLAQ